MRASVKMSVSVSREDTGSALMGSQSSCSRTNACGSLTNPNCVKQLEEVRDDLNVPSIFGSQNHSVSVTLQELSGLESSLKATVGEQEQDDVLPSPDIEQSSWEVLYTNAGDDCPDMSKIHVRPDYSEFLNELWGGLNADNLFLDSGVSSSDGHGLTHDFEDLNFPEIPIIPADLSELFDLFPPESPDNLDHSDLDAPSKLRRVRAARMDSILDAHIDSLVDEAIAENIDHIVFHTPLDKVRQIIYDEVDSSGGKSHCSFDADHDCVKCERCIAFARKHTWPEPIAQHCLFCSFWAIVSEEQDYSALRSLDHVLEEAKCDELFPSEGNYSFRVDSYFSDRYTSLSDKDIVDALKRGIVSGTLDEQISIFDSLVVELTARGYKKDKLRNIVVPYSVKRRDLVCQIQQPGLFRRRQKRSKLAKPFVYRERKNFTERPTHIEAAPNTVKRHPFLKDYIFTSTTCLYLGTLSYTNREELETIRWTIFARNQSIFDKFVSPGANWDDAQRWINQKILTDVNFRNRVSTAMVQQVKSDHGPFFQSTSGLPSEYVPTRGDAEFIRNKIVQAGDKWKETAEQMEDLLALYIVYDLMDKQSCISDKLKVLYLYVRSLGIGGLYEVCQEIFKVYESVSSVLPKFQTSEASNFMWEAISFVGVSQLLGSVFLFPMNGTVFLWKCLNKGRSTAENDESLSSFWKAFVRFLGTIKECCVSGSIDPLFRDSMTPSDLAFEAKALHAHRGQVVGLNAESVIKSFQMLHRQGSIPKSWSRPFTPDEYMSKVLHVRASIKEMVTVLPQAKKFELMAADKLLATVVESAADSFSVNTLRVQPLGVVLVGPPGTGKSMLTASIIEFVGNSMGFAVDANGRYDLQTDVNFQDNADPFKWAYVGDDLDASPKTAVAGQKNHIDWVMDICNNKPLPFESARVEEKGKNFGRPLLYLHCTNNQDLALVGFARHKDAVHRRLSLKLIVTVKSEFAKGGLVDISKAEGKFNIHNIEVQRFSEGAYHKIADLNDEQCLRFILSEFKENLVRQHAMLSSSTLKICSKCPMRVAKDQATCEACTQTSEPVLQSFFGTMGDIGAAAGNARNISSDIVDRGLVEKIDRVISRMDAATVNVDETAGRIERIVERVDNATGKAEESYETIKSYASSLGDFFKEHGPKLVVAVAAIMAVAKLCSQTSMFQSGNNQAVVAPPTWTKPEDTHPSPSKGEFINTTWTEAQLQEQVRKSIGRVRRGIEECYCLRVGGNSVIFPHHMLDKGDKDASIQVKMSGDWITLQHEPIQSGASDLVVCRVDFPDGLKHSAFPYFVNDLDLGTSSYDEVYLLTPDTIMRPTDPSIQQRLRETAKDYVGQAFHTTILTQNGDCGLPLIVKSGSFVRILGIHHLWWEKKVVFSGVKSVSSAVLVSKVMLKYLEPSVGVTMQSGTMVPFCDPGSLQPLKDSTRSELALAVSKGASMHPLGHSSVAKGRSSSASKCTKSLIATSVEPLAERFLGRKDYWQIPLMRGAMVEGEWKSGYQYIFNHYQETDSCRVLHLPIVDYLTGLKNQDLQGYRALTWEETISGLPGSVIGSVNRKTSVGPPFSGPKSQWISATGECDPIVVRQFEEIEGILDRGEIPIVVATCTLKDEPVKYSKNDTRNIRVFNCLPMGFNLICKKYLAPIKCFLRNNPFACESMVGIDMTNDGGDTIKERFSQINPGLDHVIEGDFTKMDKTINGAMAWAVVQVFIGIARFLGLDCERVALLVWANFYCMYSIHGDLFQVGGMNPSGSDITVEINGVVNSLCHRVAFFKAVECPREVFDEGRYGLVGRTSAFQRENCLCTFGDDFLLAHAKRVDTEERFSHVAKVGMIMTDAYDKSAAPKYRSLWGCTFLKRGFYPDPEDKDRVMCGLQLPSLLRMIYILKPSTLTKMDHTGTVLEEALREIFLNPNLDFEFWRGEFKKMAKVHGIASKYLKLLPKEEYRRMFNERTLRTWGLDLELEEVVIPTKQLILQMSDSLPMTSAMSDGATPSMMAQATRNLPLAGSQIAEPTPATYGSAVAGGDGDTEMSHASGNILSLTNPVKAGSVGYNRVDQAMADTQFSESLHRNVKIGYFTDFATTGAQEILRPWIEWMNNPFVADKLANFNYIRGSLVLSGVLNAPPLSSGLVVITAYPLYEFSVEAPFDKNLALVLPHVVIDLSTSSDFELTLPWIVSSDWGNTEDDLFSEYWNVGITVMSGLQAAIPNGCGQATLTIFARPGPDFELAGATFQSGRTASFNRSTARSGTRYPSQACPPGLKGNKGGIFEGRKMSEVSGAIAKGATAAAAVPMLTPIAGPIATAAAGVSWFLDLFGFTRETKIPETENALLRIGPNMTNVDGDDSSRIGALFSTNALSRDPAIHGALSAVDETSFAFINSRYQLFTTLKFIVGDTGMVDYIIPVTPCIGEWNVAGTEFLPGPAGYLAARFQFWRGDMKFLIYPVISAVHRGALQVVWQPVPKDSPITADLTNLSANTIVDLAPAQPYEITVGYNNDLPMCYTDFYTADTPISDADYSTLNGYLRIRSLVPITGSECGQEIDVLVFVAAGDNMQYGVPMDDVSIEGELHAFGVHLDCEPVFQSATVGAEGQSTIEVELIPSSGSYPVDEILMGEQVVSIRTLLQKPSLVLFKDPDEHLDISDDIAFDHWYEPTIKDSHYINYFGSLFLAMAGSVRIKVVIDRGSFIFEEVEGVSQLMLMPVVGHRPTMEQTHPVSEVSPIVTDCSFCVEQTVPYYWNEKYLPAYKKGPRADDVLDFMKGTDFRMNMLLYRSAGPDLRLTFFRGQKKWVVVEDPGERSDFQHLWTKVGRNWDFDPAPLARKTGLSVEQSEKLEIKQLDQYRARTGRRDRKVSRRGQRREALAV